MANRSSTESTSTGLLDRVRSQQAQAWAQLVRLYGPLVSYWLHRYALQQADHEDIFQEIFRAVATKIGSYQHKQPGASFRGWLRVITHNKWIDFTRRKALEPGAVGGSDWQVEVQELRAPMPEEDEASERSEIQQLRARALELVRAEFEPRTWQMFVRVVMEDAAVATVAEEFGVSAAAVRMAKSRVLSRLRQELQGLEP